MYHAHRSTWSLVPWAVIILTGEYCKILPSVYLCLVCWSWKRSLPSGPKYYKDLAPLVLLFLYTGWGTLYWFGVQFVSLMLTFFIGKIFKYYSILISLYNSPVFVCAQERYTKQNATRSSELVAMVFNAMTSTQQREQSCLTFHAKKYECERLGTRLRIDIIIARSFL